MRPFLGRSHLSSAIFAMTPSRALINLSRFGSIIFNQKEPSLKLSHSTAISKAIWWSMLLSLQAVGSAIVSFMLCMSHALTTNSARCAHSQNFSRLGYVLRFPSLQISTRTYSEPQTTILLSDSHMTTILNLTRGDSILTKMGIVCGCRRRKRRRTFRRSSLSTWWLTLSKFPLSSRTPSTASQRRCIWRRNNSVKFRKPLKNQRLLVSIKLKRNLRQPRKRQRQPSSNRSKIRSARLRWSERKPLALAAA